MQSEILSAGLCQAARRVLEETVFVLAEPLEEDAAWHETMLEAEIPFSGPITGVVTLAATLEFGTTLAANLLGIEPDELPEGENGDESLAELLNILMGMLAQEWFGNDDCDFGLPKVRRMSPVEHITARSRATISLSLITDDFEQLDLAVFLTEGQNGQ